MLIAIIFQFWLLFLNVNEKKNKTAMVSYGTDYGLNDMGHIIKLFMHTGQQI